jgi:hypothetical protein
VRGPGALKALARRGQPYFLVDETTPAIAGHAGATGGRFALRYGICLAEFFAADPPPGRSPCSEGREGDAARDLLLRGQWAGTKPVAEGSLLPEAFGPFNGLWFGLLGETVVVTGLVESEGGQAPQLIYRAVAARASGGRYAARVDAGRLHATVGGEPAPTVTLTPAAAGAMELDWRAADGRRTLRGTLAPLRSSP